MKKVCVESKHLTSLESNVVYVSNLNDDGYHCPEGLCSELGSMARPAKTILEAFSVIEKRYSIETPVTISLSPGKYSSGTISKSLTFPKNVVGFVCLLGTAILESDVNLHNIKKIDMQNIHLKGDLSILADGNHLGEVIWNVGILEGNYTYKVTDNAAHTFCMEKVKQVYEPAIPLGEVRFNSISVGRSGEAFIQKTGCFVSSPFKSKIHISENGKLNRLTQKCSIFAGGETSEFAEFAEFNDTFQDSKLETHKDAPQDFDIFDDFVKDSPKITKTWTTNHVNAKVGKGKSLFKKEIMGKSNYHSKSMDSIFNIQGEGMFHKMNIKDEAKHFLDSTRATLNIPEGEGHYSMIKAEDSSFLYILLHQRNINAPFRTGRIELNDKVRTIVTCFNSRRVSAGYETYLRGDSSYTETSNGNISISGPDGFCGTAEMVDNAEYQSTETNGIKILSNKLGKSIHNVLIKDKAKSTESSSGGQRLYTIRKPAPFKQAICKDIVQMNNSKYRYFANNMRREVEGGSMVKHLLNDSSEFDVTEQNGDCRAKLLEVNTLYSLIANDQSEARIQGSNNSKQIEEGTISTIVQNHSSNVNVISRAATVKHDSPHMSYIVRTNDEAQHSYKGTGGDITSSARQQEITTLGKSKYSGTYTNNVLKAPLLVFRSAEDGSEHVCRSDGQSLTGETFYEGPVVSKIANTSHVGKRKTKEGVHSWNSSTIDGLMQTIGGEFTSNLSTFKNLFENIDAHNTSLILNNSNFETLNSANIKSIATHGDKVDLKAKVCSFENADDNVAHIDLTHDSHENSLHDVATGICSTTSKTLIAADNIRKVKAAFTASFNNSQRDPVFAEVGELLQNSNSVQEASSNEVILGVDKDERTPDYIWKKNDTGNHELIVKTNAVTNFQLYSPLLKDILILQLVDGPITYNQIPGDPLTEPSITFQSPGSGIYINRNYPAITNPSYYSWSPEGSGTKINLIQIFNTSLNTIGITSDDSNYSYSADSSVQEKLRAINLSLDYKEDATRNIMVDKDNYVNYVSTSIGTGGYDYDPDVKTLSIYEGYNTFKFIGSGTISVNAPSEDFTYTIIDQNGVSKNYTGSQESINL